VSVHGELYCCLLYAGTGVFDQKGRQWIWHRCIDLFQAIEHVVRLSLQLSLQMAEKWASEVLQ
jgi:hypothetical protein